MATLESNTVAVLANRPDQPALGAPALPSEMTGDCGTQEDSGGLPTTKIHPESAGAKLHARAVPVIRGDGWVGMAVQSVLANRGEITTGGCVLWAGLMATNGYPEIRVCGKRYPAHRFVACFAFGPDAIRGKDVHHLCEVPECTNPDHLLPMTSSEHASHHKGAALPVRPPEYTGDLFADQVIAVMKGDRPMRRRPRRDTPLRNLERAQLCRLALWGLLANAARAHARRGQPRKSKSAAGIEVSP